MSDLTLAIESSNPSSGGSPGVAIGLVTGSEVEILDSEPLGTGERHDDLLMPAIARLMSRVEKDPGSLDRVVCSIGPGGFTGLRIATAAANMIALSAKARLFGVPSAWVAAAQTELNEPFAVALACKGDTCYLTCFGADRLPISEGSIVDPDGIAGLGISTLFADIFLPESIRAACEAANIALEPPCFSAACCLQLAGQAQEIHVGQLAPLYGREAEAVTKWRQLHPKRGS
jgi:tRNA threonylcarbamoyl adenosine modification protein YeaZ